MAYVFVWGGWMSSAFPPHGIQRGSQLKTTGDLVEDQPVRNRANTGYWAEELPAKNAPAFAYRFNSAKDRELFLAWWNDDAGDEESIVVVRDLDYFGFDFRYLLACSPEACFGAGVVSRRLPV